MNIVKIYFPDAKGTDLVSETSQGKPAKPQFALDWLKKKCLTDHLSAEELVHLTPEVFRHMWSNYCQECGDENVRRLALASMVHSAPVQNRNYQVSRISNTVKVTATIMSKILNRPLGCSSVEPEEPAEPAVDENWEDKSEDEDQNRRDNTRVNISRLMKGNCSKVSFLKRQYL